jgi:hypothetical protein
MTPDQPRQECIDQQQSLCRDDIEQWQRKRQIALLLSLPTSAAFLPRDKSDQLY